MSDFYNQLSPFYHLIYENWESSVETQGSQLREIIDKKVIGSNRKILDVACGIGTQSIGLSLEGFDVTASDLSSGAIERARFEAQSRGCEIDFSVCDMLDIEAHHVENYDAVVCADNSIPHLLSDEEILSALKAMKSRLRLGGSCIITMRDYAKEPRGKGILKPYGVREIGNIRYLIWQVWDFDGEQYTVSMYFVEDNMKSLKPNSQVMRSRYYAISTNKMLELMREAGFERVERLDNVFFQPVLVGSKNA
ncbi:bifunctional 2-polyprenyl-6-hydroxyphenol methylase/3-demethylubiquinol 3-O-methyltransferase UbiG [uncultured Alteromonas sp.]|jgi:SAM-dependent methyltransferase|uniref:class I SAM-dependent methyltransferase n=1 Tax=uncultured Alteromonas sp. TaxID=179113 RepID=UPI0025E6384B|nr:class I SAM-dependent methyltransferase [uncultured Alteromonas sp.]